jgi:taurine dioxygenase
LLPQRAITAANRGEYSAAHLDWYIDLYNSGRPNHGSLLRALTLLDDDGLAGFGDLALAHDSLEDDSKCLVDHICKPEFHGFHPCAKAP